MGMRVSYPRWYSDLEGYGFITHVNNVAEEYQETYSKVNMQFLRRRKWHQLLSLSGKTLGCWCKTEQQCHYTFIAQAFRERVAEVGGILFEGDVREGESAIPVHPVVDVVHEANEDRDEGYADE